MTNDKDYTISPDGKYRVYSDGMKIALKDEEKVGESEKWLMALIQGAKPLNAEEEEMQKQIREIEARGGYVYIPTSL